MYNVPETTLSWCYQLVGDLLAVYKLETNWNVPNTVRLRATFQLVSVFSSYLETIYRVSIPCYRLKMDFPAGHPFILFNSERKKKFTPSWNRLQICLFRKQLPYLAGRLVGLKSSLCKSSLYECLVVIRLILLLAAVTGLYCPIIHGTCLAFFFW